jgi:hypothetical protein
LKKSILVPGLTIENPISLELRYFFIEMLKATCMHCSFKSSAETFEELDEIFDFHSKSSGHRPDYHFYELGRKAKQKLS